MKTLRTLLLSLILSGACFVIATAAHARRPDDLVPAAQRSIPPTAAALTAEIARAQAECALAANPAAARLIQFGF